MSMVRCSSCGAKISTHDRVCPYCGAQNPAYQPQLDEVNVLLQKGMEAYRQEQYALAADYYRRAVELDPGVFDAYFPLAACLTALGREEEAIKAMERAREIRPGNTATYYNLGLLLKRVGRGREARQYLRQALKVLKSDVVLDDRKQMRQRIREELAGLKRWGV